MRLGLIAGGGELPKYVAQSAKDSKTPLTIVGLKGFANLDDFPLDKHVHIGQLGRTIDIFKTASCTHICMAGLVKRPDFAQIKPDGKALVKLPGIIRAATQGDDALLRHMMGLFEAEGFEIISPQIMCADLLLQEGVLGAVPFGKVHRDDALQACTIAREIGRLDIGQAAIVARGLTLCAEAQEGTDAMLARAATLPAHLRGTPQSRCGVLAKLIKPAQDSRVDMPVIGPETVRGADKAGLAGIVAGAGEAFILDRENVIKLADQAGIFIAGLPSAPVHD